MPVRSLRSPVLKWPDAPTVDRAVRHWAQRIAQQWPKVRRVGYFGSYARGDWGVGSDVDLIVIVDGAAAPFERRAAQLGPTQLPVPADVLVYTVDEWEALGQSGRFAPTVEREAVWIIGVGPKA